MVDKELFFEARDKMNAKAKGEDGIGTLREKSVHATLKFYFAPNDKNHEVKIGDYVADVCIDGEIFEIQTRQFYSMKKKLSYYLEEGYDVTVVYPVKEKNTIVWIDRESGELKEGRAVTNKRKVNVFFRELYGIRDFIDNPLIHFVIVKLETKDYRFLDGFGKDKKIRATKTDIYPVDIIDEIRIDSIDELCLMLPKNLPNEFDLKTYAGLMGLNLNDANMSLLIFERLGVFTREKSGRKNIYKKVL